MEKVEKVQINIGPDNKWKSPVGTCVPPKGNFLLTPKNKPNLTKIFKAISWDCANCKIDLKIKETPKFDGYQWFSEFKKSNTDAFAEEEGLTLVFFDQDKTEIAGFSFTGLNLDSHTFYEDTENDSQEDGEIYHYISIIYKSCKNIFFREAKEDELMINVDPGERIDHEWKFKH